MRNTNRIKALGFALLLSCLFPLSAYASETERSSSNVVEGAEQAAYFGSSDLSLRGLQIDSSYQRDYPLQNENTAASLSAEASELVKFAKEYQFNTLFYEVSPRADAVFRSNYLPSSRYICTEEGALLLSDPLNVLAETAEMERLNVVASLSMFYAGETTEQYSDDSPVSKHPEWFIDIDGAWYFDPRLEEVQEYWVNVVAELATGYDLDGLVLTNLDCFTEAECRQAAQELVNLCLSHLHRIDNTLSVGISLPVQAIAEPAWQQYVQEQGSQLNFVIPKMTVSLDDDKGYQEYLAQWKHSLDEQGIRLYTSNQAKQLRQPLIGETCFGDKNELCNQLYANALLGTNGYLIDSYSSIKDLNASVASALTLVPDTATAADQKLVYTNPTSLSLAESETYITTQARRYYLSGRCDPTQELYINGELVDPSLISKQGFWGIWLDLDRGSNRFAVRQGDSSRRITVYSTIKEKQQEELLYLDDILPSSVYPQDNTVLYEGASIHLSCLAPYGGSVVAYFCGEPYRLTALVGEKEPEMGQAVEYALDVQLDEIDSTVTSNLGKVSYILTYDDFSSKYRSEGQIYLVGSGSRLAVKVANSLGRVYQDLDEEGLVSTLPYGSCDYASSVENTDYYRLYSGGYIAKKDVDIMEGFVDIQRSVEAVGLQSNEQGETLIFVGGEGLPFYIRYNEHSKILTFQLYNLVSMQSSLSHLSSNLFERIVLTKDDASGMCTIRFYLKQGESLWGYYVSCENGNLYLKCKTPPTLSNDPNTPLKELCVVLDPGHGGVDSGGQTIWGLHGPQEKDITLAYAQSLSRRLEQMGAEVYLTRADDSTMDEEDRILYSFYKDADLYLSFHGTELQDIQGTRKQQGLSVFYDSERSYGLGRFLYQNLSEYAPLSSNQLSGDDLSVVKVPLAQAIQLCPGVLTDAKDYERMTDPIEIYKTTSLISDLLVEYFHGN